MSPPGDPRPAALPRQLQRLVDDARARWWSTAAPTAGTATERLAAAISGGELRVAYQPIVELADQRLVAMEALVRLPEPGHPELATPSCIVAVAEASGLVDALGTEVLVHACSQLAAWRGAAHLRDLQVHVNVSPLQLRDERFATVVARTLQVTNLPPSTLVLEVTETAAFERDGVAENTLAALSRLDVEIAIDDFGTGFASLELLASTPARSIKLDRGFVASVEEITAPPRGRAVVVQAALGLARTLGLRVVAEGIETPAQARTLAAWGCLYGQGFLYARPRFASECRLPPPPASARARPAVAGRSDHLSIDATDLALALATIAATTQPAGGTIRADAQELALALAEVHGLDRRQADTAAVLATIADAAQRFAEVVNPRSTVPAAVELARVLGSRSDLGPGATPGAVAAAARRLAVARRDGSTLEEARTGIAGDLGEELGRRIETWWHDTSSSPSPLLELRTIERRLRSRDDASRRLRALSALTHAIGGAGSLEDVLEVTAEEARGALGAASLTISRLDREHGLLRILVNVGELEAWEERRPTDHTYPLSDFPTAIAALLDGVVHLQVTGSATIDPNEQRLLDATRKSSSAAVPIVVDGTTWGDVYATTASGAPPFTSADAPFLSAIASVISLAIRRSEHVGRLTQLAGEDPLTRLPNRSALERRLAIALAPDPDPAAVGTEVGLLILDVEGLTTLNDRYGQAEGDHALVRVADVVSRVALTRPGAFAARLGGDEFCIVLEGACDDAEELVGRIRTRLADGPSPQPGLSAGFAAVRRGTVGVSELLRRADAAQYLARRTGAPLAAVGPDSDIPSPSVLTLVPRATMDEAMDVPLQREGRAVTGATDAALQRWSDGLADRSLLRRLQGLGEAVGAVLDLNRWVLSEHHPADGSLTTSSVNVRRRKPDRPLYTPAEYETFHLDDYPATAAAFRDVAGFSVHVDDAAADRHERALLLELGLTYLLAIPAVEGDERWLLELYGDERSTRLADARHVLEALASRTIGRPVSCPPS